MSHNSNRRRKQPAENAIGGRVTTLLYAFQKPLQHQYIKVEPKDHAFLRVLTGNSDTSYTSSLRNRIQYKLDTGAEVTVFSEITYYKMEKFPLQKVIRSHKKGRNLAMKSFS